MPVATLAEGMMQDAWNYFSSGGSSADKVIVLGNSDIRRLSEVSCYIEMWPCIYMYLIIKL
jgi:hypothetical protein